jgi:hypothetical protein
LRKISEREALNIFYVIFNDAAHCWEYIVSATGEGWAWSGGGIKLPEEDYPLNGLSRCCTDILEILTINKLFKGIPGLKVS